MTGGIDDGLAQLAQGFRCVAYWGDLWIYKQGLRQGITALQHQCVVTAAGCAAPVNFRAALHELVGKIEEFASLHDLSPGRNKGRSTHAPWA